MKELTSILELRENEINFYKKETENIKKSLVKIQDGDFDFNLLEKIGIPTQLGVENLLVKKENVFLKEKLKICQDKLKTYKSKIKICNQKISELLQNKHEMMSQQNGLNYQNNPHFVQTMPQPIPNISFNHRIASKTINPEIYMNQSQNSHIKQNFSTSLPLYNYHHQNQQNTFYENNNSLYNDDQYLQVPSSNNFNQQQNIHIEEDSNNDYLDIPVNKLIKQNDGQDSMNSSKYYYEECKKIFDKENHNFSNENKSTFKHGHDVFVIKNEKTELKNEPQTENNNEFTEQSIQELISKGNDFFSTS